MELDLSEYDQVDEIKLMMENNEQFYGENANKFLVTLSSCSDQTSTDEANCENDFVFLPAPANPNLKSDPNSNNQSLSSNNSPSARSQNNGQLQGGHGENRQVGASSGSSGLIVTQPQSIGHPLVAINTNGPNNPFGNGPKEVQTYEALGMGWSAQNQSSSPALKPLPETCHSKPLGVLEIPTAIASNNSSKLTELMQQIVTRSDLIYIAVPCAYCHEPVACPPADISSWLNHMSKQHNCKLCPVCSKLIGLGPRRDIEIMKRHVMEHFDEDWLERRALKVSFTFGLQQQWFSGNRCSVKDTRYM